MKYIFIRNDDVREKLDDSLITITNECIKRGIPICHAVEPANVSLKVENWLKDLKKQTNLIEIVQHGYSHKLNYIKKISGVTKKGEFGGDRTFEDQYNEIKKGMDLMNKKFHDDWFKLFTFPYGARNQDCIKAIDKCGFKAVNGSMGVSIKHKTFYLIGRLLKKEMLFNKKVSYNLKYKPNTNLFQIDTSISIIDKFNDEFFDGEFLSLDQLKKETSFLLNNTNIVGIVLHHRYHTTDKINKLFTNYLNWLITIPNVKFVTQEFLYNKFGKK